MNTFLKVFGVPRTFFQKDSWPLEAALPLSYKPQFEEWLNRYFGGKEGLLPKIAYRRTAAGQFSFSPAPCFRFRRFRIPNSMGVL